MFSWIIAFIQHPHHTPPYTFGNKWRFKDEAEFSVLHVSLVLFYSLNTCSVLFTVLTDGDSWSLRSLPDIEIYLSFSLLEDCSPGWIVPLYQWINQSGSSVRVTQLHLIFMKVAQFCHMPAMPLDCHQHAELLEMMSQ